MYKKAAELQLRFSTLKGNLNVEQLFHLTIEELDKLAVALEESYKNSKGKSFLDKKTSKDVTIKLQFDIVLDILNTKVENAEALRSARETKEHNQKILNLIAAKKDAQLQDMSISELEAMMK